MLGGRGGGDDVIRLDLKSENSKSKYSRDLKQSLHSQQQGERESGRWKGMREYVCINTFA